MALMISAKRKPAAPEAQPAKERSPEDDLPRFSKGVLSHDIHSRCDLALYLSMFRPETLGQRNLPVPLPPRPGLNLIRDAGNEFESSVYEALKSRFGDMVMGRRKEPSKAEGSAWETMDLVNELERFVEPRAFLTQVRFTLGNRPLRFLERMGVPEAFRAKFPLMGEFIPDLLVARPARPGLLAMDTDGERAKLSPSEALGRTSLLVVDIKHAAKPNPSYEAETVLYAVLLANWLEETGLSRRFVVEGVPRLWTSGGDLSGKIASLGADAGEAVEALVAGMDEVNVAIHATETRRFMSERVPDVLSRGDESWEGLGWHVSSKCNACTWLGHEEWANPEGKRLIEAKKHHYCMTRAKAGNDLSRIPDLPRGAARALRKAGVADLATLTRMSPSDLSDIGHTYLTGSRRVLPEIARAVGTREIKFDDRRVDGMLPAYSNLTVYVGVGYDNGADRLTGIGLKTTFWEPRPKDDSRPKDAPRPKHDSDLDCAFVVDRKTAEAEKAAVMDFLASLGKVIEAATKPVDGARSATACVVFWSRGHFESLGKAIGRHLPAIIAGGDDAQIGLAWLFPGPGLQRRSAASERQVAVAILRDTARRLLRMPVEHAFTLDSVLATYHFVDPTATRLPNPFYTEPLSDSIPRERIYEIWAKKDGAPVLMNVRVPKPGVPRSEWTSEVQTFTREKLKENFAVALRVQAWGIATMTRFVRKSFDRRLKARAAPITTGAPAWQGGVAFDSKLRLAHAQFEMSQERHACYLRFVADPEEVESSHEGMRLTRLLERRPDGTSVYEIAPGSRDAKVKNGDKMCVSFEQVPGFLAVHVFALFDGPPPESLKKSRYRRTDTIFTAEVVDVDRSGLKATLRLPAIGTKASANSAGVRFAVTELLGNRFERDLCLLPALPPSITFDRLRDFLSEVGDPGIALPDASTCKALGLPETMVAGSDPTTPAARVIWDAERLSRERAMPAARVDVAVAFARGAARLDETQEAAVRNACERRLTLLWGPPGTGKTNTLGAFLHGLCREALDSGNPARILVSGPTYKAVGELAARFLRGAEADGALRVKMVVLAPDGREVMDRAPPNVPWIDYAKTPADEGAKAFKDMSDALKGDGITLVFAITHQCARLSERLRKLDGGDRLRQVFDTVVVDEASQVDMGLVTFPLALLREDGRVVVGGDHKQMPPVQAVEPPEGAETVVGSVQSYLESRKVLPTKLGLNYRSNEEIVSYCRGLGYPDDLRAANASASVRLLREPASAGLPALAAAAGLPWSRAFEEILAPSRGIVAVTYPDGIAGQSNSFEAEIVAAVALAMRTCNSREMDGYPRTPEHGPWDDGGFLDHGIGVVTPHRAQKARVVAALGRAFPAMPSVGIEKSVDTVERFQGGERHSIIVSFGVGDPDVIGGEEKFLMGLERTNVAISRAMAKCVLVMSDELSSHIPVDAKASRDAHAVRGVVDAWCRNRVTFPIAGGSDPSRRVTVRWR